MANSTLATYNEKRNFRKTSEPRGTRAPSKTKLQFVVQRHEASHLHYDFRLELDGVLKSWAVPKEPIPDPKTKRLAVQVEDHPVAYGSFEGDIPEGEYGAGHVDIWDSGEWKPLDKNPLKAYEAGKLSFELFGNRLKGKWNLIRTGGFGKSKSKKNWLLMKANDSPAKTSPEVASSAKATKAKKKKKAEFMEPQLATLVEEPPKGSEWLFENKFDGYRILASTGNKVQLFSRYGNDWTKRFASVAKKLKSLKLKAVFDGEVVALNEKGVSDFQALQNSQNTDRELVYFVFDLLEEDGEDLRDLSLFERKRRLKALVSEIGSENVRFSEHTVGDGKKVFAKACKKGDEGIICKRMDATYSAGRTENWLKVKCTQRQEFVVVGYTDPKGSREKFGALLLATRSEAGADLEYVGKVGTGFTRESLKELHAKMAKLASKKNALSTKISERKVHWLNPKLVAEINFAGWTNDKILRQPSFVGLREDKASSEVKIEKAKKIARSPKASSSELTHPDKVLFSGQGVTKQELADYYESVAKLMLPYVEARPLTLVRCPRGDEKTCFFQKHYQKGMGAGLAPVSVKEKTKTAHHVSLSSKDGLRSLAQMGVLEVHTWGSRADDIDRPDQIVFDFDPDPSTSWKEVVEGIFMLRDYLEELGLKPFCKLSGGKGVHVHVPIVPNYSWEEVRAFSEKVAREMEKREPETFTTNSLKKKRPGKLYLDYVRNNKGTTFVAPYSTRAKENAPVAAPIAWKELNAKLSPQAFTVANFNKRLTQLKKSDPWKGFSKSARKLP